jgi:hypothetical protein
MRRTVLGAGGMEGKGVTLGFGQAVLSAGVGARIQRPILAAPLGTAHDPKRTYVARERDGAQ